MIHYIKSHMYPHFMLYSIQHYNINAIICHVFFCFFCEICKHLFPAFAREKGSCFRFACDP